MTQTEKSAAELGPALLTWVRSQRPHVIGTLELARQFDVSTTEISVAMAYNRRRLCAASW